MDIAVCGAQAVFTRGGAELLMEQLVERLAAAGHRAELIRLPVAWDRQRIFDAALAWRFVPVDADLVIATNFPSYFVRHPRKVVWLPHQHRAAYDAADSPWSDFGLDDESLDAERLLADWDTRALSEAERIFTISGVVSERLARYNGLASQPLYHPPPLYGRLHPGPFGDYVFCATRLEQNKRPELLVESLAHVQAPVRAVVAGRGSRRDHLLRRAREIGVTDRLELPGFVDDDDLVERFANALAVVYTPHEEDYGYVTLQAFRAGKPVITAADSGGVLEWVEDGVTGLVTDGTPAGIAKAIDRLATDHELVERLSAAARERVSTLSWDPVVARLTGA